ncbi:putative F-box protein [Cardamine amara subsp. amara]|uniref:F-box protein n=1 Tax=Cardamine amara subsp. amara TaxID=228776 RepID=A0ABD1A4G5_CARAN
MFTRYIQSFPHSLNITMEKKKHNPNSHKRLKRDTFNSWSELTLDLLNLVLERLSFANFQRAKSVCSSWYSASRQCVPKSQIPWLLLFPENNNENSCTLFNPEEKEKLYKTQDFGVEFTKSGCIATYGSWFLMQDPQYNLYIMNIFTRERIDLPSVESQLGMVKVERTMQNWFRILNYHNGSRFLFSGMGMDVRSPVFWIDDKTKDYVVIWGLGSWSLVYSKKGDKLWNQIPDISDCLCMIYKDHKLYFFSCENILTIIDFSREVPQQTFVSGMLLLLHVFDIATPDYSGVVESKFVVTVTGDILKVEKIRSARSKTYNLRVFKVYSPGFLEKHELINSLGDESVLFDQGITVLANDTNGVIRNSIYFSDYGKNTNDIFLFNLKTQKTKLLHTFDCSLGQFSRAQWFLPT